MRRCVCVCEAADTKLHICARGIEQKGKEAGRSRITCLQDVR